MEDPGSVLTSSIFMLESGGELTQIDSRPALLFVDWLSHNTLGIVEFDTPGRILAVPVSNTERESVLWTGQGVASFDWRNQ